jgi:hypothetical protein
VVLHSSEKVEDLSTTKLLAFGSEKNQDTINLRLGLIALSSRSMFEKGFRRRALLVELAQPVNIGQ